MNRSEYPACKAGVHPLQTHSPYIDRRFIEWPVRNLFVLHNSSLRLASERTRAKLSCVTLPQAVVYLMRPTLTLFPLLIWRCFCRANRGGGSTEVRTPISSVKGWPPSQLEDGTIKQDSTLACSVAVISTDTAGREDFLVPPRIADDIRDYHFNGSALLFRTRRFKRKNTLSRISNIYYASDAEAAKISNIGSCVPKRSLTLLRSKTVSILAETRLGDARGS